MNGNSAKFYDKAYSPWGSVLRGAETTLHTVKDFRVYRAKEGGPEGCVANYRMSTLCFIPKAQLMGVSGQSRMPRRGTQK